MKTCIHSLFLILTWLSSCSVPYNYQKTMITQPLLEQKGDIAASLNLKPLLMEYDIQLSPINKIGLCYGELYRGKKIYRPRNSHERHLGLTYYNHDVKNKLFSGILISLRRSWVNLTNDIAYTTQ